MDEINAQDFRDRVQSYINDESSITAAFEPLSHNETDPELHAMRVAWLYHHGWEDVISLDVGIPSLGFTPEWIIGDGNHRLYAAILREDDEIHCSASGQIDYAEKILGIEEPQDAKNLRMD